MQLRRQRSVHHQLKLPPPPQTISYNRKYKVCAVLGTVCSFENTNIHIRMAGVL